MRRIAFVVATLGLASAGLAGWQAPPPAPLFRAGVDYVSVDVVVTGKNDAPIEGLTKADFGLTENKKPQTIQYFQ
jgi:hypothetical protein